MSFYPDPPENFQIENLQILPSASLDLTWDIYTDDRVRNDYLNFNDENHQFATMGTNPPHIFAHNRDVIGYRLFRNEDTDFDPLVEGDLLADEFVLEQNDDIFTDNTVIPNTTYFFKLAAVVCNT